MPVRVELEESGSWIEYREKLMAGDKFAVMASFEVSSNPETGRSQMPGGLINIWRNALLERIITAWGGGPLEGVPIPSLNIGGIGVLDDLLPIEDYNTLAEAVEPLLAKVVANPNQQGRGKRPSSSNAS